VPTAVVREAHDIPERDPIRVEVGDVVEVGDRDTEWPAFVFITGEAGGGWVPSRHLSAETGTATVETAYDTTELPTLIGEELEILEEDSPSGWLWCRAPDGREGWVPEDTVEIRR
jgi:hypothetical protein